MDMKEAHRENRKRVSESVDWRELVKPLFLQMHKFGVKELTVKRNGGDCNLSMLLDEITEAAYGVAPPPVGFTTLAHLDAAAEWEDRDEMLRWAAENGASVAEMKAWHRATHGEDLVIES